ncbi:alpha/beta hydrolase (plasmid) [Paracoccus methylovorus]|uniref:Alpha/beta hydrolase n=1 Tax=Paracoccus methylovorus TaxID=2812658 RepID=A0ABX7JPW8_9RHOB|nr:alpha/beta hydrolase [Paracoccus methylovorus]QRZ16140.1 alpha/beta hydrolase [Paracoccus methylovorus]
MTGQSAVPIGRGVIGIEADPPGKPALLLVHGFLSSARHWDLNLVGLRSRYRLVRAELPGHGHTPGCTDPLALAPEALVADLETARQELGIPRWHICGQSFGTGLTLRYALRHPAAVGAQVWTNASRALSTAITPEVRAADTARCEALEAEGVEALRRERFHPRHGRRFPSQMRDLLGAEADGCDIPTVIAIIRHTLPQLSVRDIFARTTVPTLLVNGRMESRFQPVRALAGQLLPTLRVVDLPGGHAINIEQPDLFDDAVLAFLAPHDALIGAT